MTLFVGPVTAHAPEDFHPPGITVDSWCYLVSTVSLANIEDFVTLNAGTIGASTGDIRTPALGSLVTYIALTADQRTAAVTAGASPAPTDGKCRAKAFDAPAASWEPV
jgi:hypothetical protein